MYGYVYVTTNLINGKKYIGQHTSSEFDPNYKGSGTYLWNAINKYGWDNFIVEMMCSCFSKEELNSEEIFLIDYFNAAASTEYYNIASGGQGGDTFSGLSESDYQIRIQKVSRGQRGVKRPKGFQIGNTKGRGNRGKVRSAESRLRMSENHYKHASSEHKAKISESLIGNKRRLGYQTSESTKDRISANSRGRIWVHNDTSSKFIKPDELEGYLMKNYILGRGRLRF